jgi:glycosyltransferase involved in cell wall biosynthesis
MKRNRILACTFTCCPPGKPGFTGGEDILGWNLLKQISQHYEVWSVTNADDRNSIEEGLQENPNPNLHFSYVGLPKWLRPLLRIQGGHQFYYFLWQIRAYFDARKLHKNHKFDLFHHITYANDWAASYIGALLPIPYVRGPGGGAHRTPKGFEQEYTFGGRVWERVRSLGQWFLRRDPFYVLGHRRSSAILVCNLASLAAVPPSWAKKAHLFPVTGVSSDDLTQPDLNKKSGPIFRVLSAGSLIRVKGFSLAIKAFKEFSEQYPDTEFNIIGSGPEELKLRAVIEEYNLEANVHLLGHMPRAELLSNMEIHDVFLFPSLRDGGGAVVIEAMAAGKPVVCLDTGGPGMHIDDQLGFKVVPRSPKTAVHELALALELLYNDEGLRHKMGQAAFKRARDYYHWDKLGEQLMEIYKDTLETRNQI